MMVGERVALAGRAQSGDSDHVHASWVPEPLDQLIASLLAKDPALRPATAADVAHRLERTRDPAMLTSPTCCEPLASTALVSPASGERRDTRVTTTLGQAAAEIGGPPTFASAPLGARHRIWWGAHLCRHNGPQRPGQRMARSHR